MDLVWWIFSVRKTSPCWPLPTLTLKPYWLTILKYTPEDGRRLMILSVMTTAWLGSYWWMEWREWRLVRGWAHRSREQEATASAMSRMYSGRPRAHR